ncbi:MAG: type I 3-dehydroquinate dehydratase [Treponema sp.]|jgi:3-dehydroquinate dehydratase/shikimate dehydrogenase|nr:type I 3-dehydroquinate dehydratase [Treponema sp.]
MAKICLCLTGSTLQRDVEVLEKYRKFVDIVELRADYLTPDERLLIRRFPEMAGIPCILTVRREVDGGLFHDGEWSRIKLISLGLAFAEADRRRNFAYVDLENDLSVPGIEEAARIFGTRIIRSYHNMNGIDDDITGILRRSKRVGDEIVKVAVTPHSLDDMIKIFRAAKETEDLEKVVIGIGEFGLCTRVLADRFGSQITYTSAKGESDMPTAVLGHLDPKELSEFYRFKSINEETAIFGVTGFPLKVTLSPSFFNAAFGVQNVNAVYLPFPAVSISAFMRLADEIGLKGASVTIPYKSAVVPYLTQKSDHVRLIGACNTIVREEDGWHGYNTDAMGFSESLLNFLGAKDLKGKRVAIIGAGGAARAVVEEVRRFKGKALILNRTPIRARELAETFGFKWAELDSAGFALMEKYRNVIIQTTSAGMDSQIDVDPIEMFKFSGKEAVMDVIYHPQQTKCLERAAKAGCRILNGYDMFIRQARAQFHLFTKRELPAQDLLKITL